MIEPGVTLYSVKSGKVRVEAYPDDNGWVICTKLSTRQNIRIHMDMLRVLPWPDKTPHPTHFNCRSSVTSVDKGSFTYAGVASGLHDETGPWNTTKSHILYSKEFNHCPYPHKLPRHISDYMDGDQYINAKLRKMWDEA